MASGSASFIDLTLEPDSPELQPRTTANIRRGQQQQQAGQPVQVIDLTEIADDDDTPTISGSRTLPGPGHVSGPGRGWLDSRPRLPFGHGGSTGNMAQDAHSRARSLFDFTGLNAFSVGGLEGLARFTNFALDSIPSLGTSLGSGSGTGSGTGSGSSSDNNRSGRPQGIASRRRPGRHVAPGSSRHMAGAGGVGDGGSSGVRGPDVFFGAASLGSLLDPLGGNQPDLNYENNGYLDLHQQLHLNIQQHHIQNQQQAAQAVARARQRHHDRHNRHYRHHLHHHYIGDDDGGGGGGGRVDPDKPPYVAPADPPAGFSRSTGEDMVAVCVSCDEELVYDSNQGSDGKDGKDGNGKDGPAAPTPKRKQSRKERAEHPFWAVTGCGHVYCRRCFDNRRNALKGDKLPAVDFKTDGKAIFCAAEDCRTDVTAKKAWIGLFV